MAPDVVSKLQTLVSGESKSARKKKGKGEAATAVPAAPEQTSSEVGAGGSDAAGKANGTDSENSYIRELQKNIRNINKKLSATQKVDSIIEANPGVSLDDLLASRKINADQKAQAERKPGLQAQLAQYEEQYGHYTKYGQELEAKFAREKEILSKAHSGELEVLRETIKAEAALEQKKLLKDKILTLSRFLRAAAARRQLEDDDSDLTKAFEGALLQVYGGDATAVLAAEKLIDGAEDGVPSTEGVVLSITYSQVKQAALEEAPFAAEEAWVDDVAQSQPAPPEVEASEAVSDPTITNAGLTEISESMAVQNSGVVDSETLGAPAASSIEPEAANAAAEAQWDKQATAGDDPLSESFEIVPRDPAETETPHVAAPVTSTQSWADDTPEPTVAPAAASGNDGFSEVHHNRGGRGRGGHPGGDRGGYRGRGRGGPRGDFRGGRGRGRGEFRGPRGGFRGPPRGESS
ncbi:Nn.00g077880.m01.CDS01 [Neocucurbitaria sp. VM-36]